MSLFNNPRGGSPAEPNPPDNSIPVEVFDLSKRYDLYCHTPSEDRLYENIRVVGIRSFEKKKHDYGTSLIGGYLEIESPSGARMMIPNIRIYMICEHGIRPDYKLLRVHDSDDFR